MDGWTTPTHRWPGPSALSVKAVCSSSAWAWEAVTGLTNELLYRVFITVVKDHHDISATRTKAPFSVTVLPVTLSGGGGCSSELGGVSVNIEEKKKHLSYERLITRLAGCGGIFFHSVAMSKTGFSLLKNNLIISITIFLFYCVQLYLFCIGLLYDQSLICRLLF